MPASGPDIDDPDLPLLALFGCWPTSAGVFLAHGMGCFGCPIAPFHTVVDACVEYGLDERCFRAELRRALAVVPPGAHWRRTDKGTTD